VFPLFGVLVPDPGVLLFPLLGEFPLEGPLLGLLFGLLFGLLELGPLDGTLLGPLLGLLGPLFGPLLGTLFPGLPAGVFPLLLVFPGVFGLEGGVVVAGGRPGTPRPFKEESNKGACSRERLVTT
jgi:hypothetical protein